MKNKLAASIAAASLMVSGVAAHADTRPHATAFSQPMSDAESDGVGHGGRMGVGRLLPTLLQFGIPLALAIAILIAVASGNSPNKK